MRLLVLGISFSFILLSCVNEFSLEGLNYDRLIVVDALLTDETKRHEVKLFYTLPVNSPEDGSNNAVRNANVSVNDSQGNSFIYREDSPGIYISEDAFAAIENVSYQLEITTTNGDIYQSNQTEIIKSPEISEIYPKFMNKIDRKYNDVLSGIQFYINSFPSQENQKYFRYEWEHTYELITPFVSIYDFDYETNTAFLREQSIKTCYVTEYSQEIELANSSSNQNNMLNEIPINYIMLGPYRSESDILRNRYTIQVKQYALNVEDYNYYQQIKRLTDDNGTLFDRQLGSVVGNMRNINDEDELILGNFEVAGVSIKREFFSPNDYPEPYERPRYRFNCGLGDMRTIPTDSIAFYMNNFGGYRIINIDSSIVIGGPVSGPIALLGTDRCTDCTIYGSLERPDFWIDE